MITRRLFAVSTLSFIAAPAIVRASSIMPIPLYTWREARRAEREARWIVDNIRSHEEAIAWLDEQVRIGLQHLIESQAPIPLRYNDNGFKAISIAADETLARFGPPLGWERHPA